MPTGSPGKISVPTAAWSSRVTRDADPPRLGASRGQLRRAASSACRGLAACSHARTTPRLGRTRQSALGLAREAANSGTKALTVIGSMLAGGDSIDDTDLLRAGASRELFTPVRAPSTIGACLRAFKWSNVQRTRRGLARAVGAPVGRRSRPPSQSERADDLRSRLDHHAGLRTRQAGCGLRLHQDP